MMDPCRDTPPLEFFTLQLANTCKNDVIYSRQKCKTDPLIFTFFSFQSSNFQFCKFSPLTFNFFQFKAPLKVCYC